VGAFRITPDGSEVVYLADQRTAGVSELFVVPLDRSRPARRLSGPLIARGDVADFVFTPDEKRVVYRADALRDDNFDLFSVPLAPSGNRFQRAPGDGEPDVVQLTALARSAVQPDYAVAADGTQVVFRADVFRDPGRVPDRPELFRVPLLGGQAPARLSRPVDDAGLVLSFELARDGKRIVYLADEHGDDRRRLFGAGVLAGQAVALEPLPAFVDVSTYRITPDSTAVVFVSDPTLNEGSRLFRAPVDGSEPPVELNDPLPAGGNVLADFAVLPGGSVAYRADQQADDVFELFATQVVGR
jgi:Tol biopolymer transport system component